MKHLKQNKEALASFLTALDLEPENADELTDHIASVAAAVCHLPKDMMDSLKGENIGPVKQNNLCKIVIIFLSISLTHNICFG